MIRPTMSTATPTAAEMRIHGATGSVVAFTAVGAGAAGNLPLPPGTAAAAPPDLTTGMPPDVLGRGLVAGIAPEALGLMLTVGIAPVPALLMLTVGRPPDVAFRLPDDLLLVSILIGKAPEADFL